MNEELFMTLSISGTASVQQVDTPAPARAASKPAPPPAPAPPTDIVALSLTAQVSQLKTQGLRPSQIADDLGISVTTVNSDLGIVTAAVASTPVAVPAPAPA